MNGKNEGKKMATIQLKHLTLVKLIDAAYLCGKDRQPVFIHIAGDTGIGKTWSTKSLEEHEVVTYFSASFSPNEYKYHIKERSKSTRLFIHDDVGRGNPKYMHDFISTFCDIAEGHIEFRQFKKNLNANFNFSAVFTSTSEWYNNWRDVARGMGYLDRVLSLQLELHPSTEKKYQTACFDSVIEGNLSKDPAQRKVSVIEKHDPANINRCDINPRNLVNLLRLSCYLTPPELEELINVVIADKPKYSL